jgi:hypothetical protein
MSEDIKNEDVVPATIEANEPVIAPEVAEKAAEIVEAIKEEAKIEEAPKPAEDVITGPKGSGTSEAQALGSVEDGVIGTGKAAPKKPAAPKPAKPLTDDVAIYSSRNMHWEGVGKISKGFNIVTKEAAEKWLTKGNIRLADPKEVAKGYGL